MLSRSDPVPILVIDDNPEVLETYRNILDSQDEDTVALRELECELKGKKPPSPIIKRRFRADMAPDGLSGFTLAKLAAQKDAGYPVAFVDMTMPGGWNGLDTIQAIWNVMPDMQIVLCSAFTDHSWEEIIQRIGSSDKLLMLQKPFEKIEIYQLAYALSEKWFNEQERDEKLEEMEGKIEEQSEQILTERKTFESQIYHNATHDHLTGLPNRSLLSDRLDRAIIRAKRSRKRMVVANIGLDRFKRINESLGLKVGDKLLQAVTRRMLKVIRTSDTLTRLGGDEFVLLLPDCGGSNSASRIVERVQDIIARPFHLNDIEINLTCSIGCSSYPEDGARSSTLLRSANTALSAAKERGGNCTEIHNPVLREHMQQRFYLETELRRAIKEKTLSIHYQPQVDLKTGQIVGLEALLRWHHEKLGDISPENFIPIAEESKLMKRMSLWILKTVCRQGTIWQQKNILPNSLAINISASQFTDPAFPSQVAQCLKKTRFDPSHLELELTESTAMQNPHQAIPLMEALKALGVSLSIDDFGTGYSNMNYLKRFPIDKLKLDGSFIKDITRDARDLAIVGAIITMAQQLGLKVIGEMAETEGQIINLARQGCDEIQGYYCSAPVNAEECEKLLQGKTLPLPDSIMHPLDKQVLVLSENQHLLDEFLIELNDKGYKLIYSQNTTEALNILSQHTIPVVLYDKPSNLAFLNSLNQHYPDVIRILICKQQDINLVITAINKGGAYQFLTQPWFKEELFDVLEQAFELHYQTQFEIIKPAESEQGYFTND